MTRSTTGRLFSAPRQFARLATLCAALLLAVPITACDDSDNDASHLAKAREYRQKGNINASNIELKNLLKDNPDHAEARLLLGLNDLDLGKAAAAEVEIRRARSAGADPGDVMVALGRAYLMQGKFEEMTLSLTPTDEMSKENRAELAVLRGLGNVFRGRVDDGEKAFKEALSLDSKAFGAHLGFARIALIRNNLAEAESQLNKAIEIAPNDEDTLYFKGEIAMRKGQNAVAEEVFQKLVTQRPERVNYQLALSRVLIANKKLEDAIIHLDHVLKAFPKLPQANYLRGVASMAKKDFAEAEQSAEDVLAVASNDLPAMFLAASAGYHLGHYEKALIYLQRYVNAVPSNTEARLLLARTQLRMGKSKDALATVEAYAKKDDAEVRFLAVAGDAALRAGQPKEAESYLQRALALDPNNAGIRASLGQAQLQSGRTNVGLQALEEAAKSATGNEGIRAQLIMNLIREKRLNQAQLEVERFRKDWPKSVTGHALSAFVYSAMGRHDDAKEQLLKGWELEPGRPDIGRNLAQYSFWSGKPEEGEKYLQEVLQRHPGHFATTMELASLRLRQKKADEAYNLLRQMIEKYPNRAAPAVMLADALVTANDPVKGLAVAADGLSRMPRDPQLLRIQGKAQMLLGRYQEARRTFQLLADVRPDRVEPKYWLALANEDLRDWSGMEAALKAAVKVAPDHLPSRVAKVRLAGQLGKVQEAQRDLRYLQQKYPDRREVRELAGEVAMMANRPKEAIEIFEKLQAEQNSRSVVLKLAIAELRNDDSNGAISTLQRWLEDYPDDLLVRKNLASLWLSRQKLDQAIPELEKVVAAAPNDAQANNNLAWALKLAGKSAEALPHAKRAVELSPNTPGMMDTYGIVLMDVGEVEKALPLLREANRLEPTDPSIKFHLSQGYAKMGRKKDAIGILREIVNAPRNFDEKEAAQKLLAELGG